MSNRRRSLFWKERGGLTPSGRQSSPRFSSLATDSFSTRSLTRQSKGLQISRGLLRGHLIQAHLPVRWQQLRRICESLRHQLSPPPPVYVFYHKSVRDNSLLDDCALELLTPVTDYHFDHTMLILTRFSIMGPDGEYQSGGLTSLQVASI